MSTLYLQLLAMSEDEQLAWAARQVARTPEGRRLDETSALAVAAIGARLMNQRAAQAPTPGEAQLLRKGAKTFRQIAVPGVQDPEPAEPLPVEDALDGRRERRRGRDNSPGRSKKDGAHPLPLPARGQHSVFGQELTEVPQPTARRARSCRTPANGERR